MDIKSSSYTSQSSLVDLSSRSQKTLKLTPSSRKDLHHMKLRQNQLIEENQILPCLMVSNFDAAAEKAFKILKTARP